MSDFWKDLTAVALAVIGLAMLAVFVKSQNSANILQSGFGGMANLIGAASRG